MEASQDDKETNSLEGPDVTPNTPESTAADGSGGGDKDKKPEQKKRKLDQRMQGIITRVNIYLLLFILILVIAAGIVIVSMQRSKREAVNTNLNGQELTAEELEKIKGSDAKVGDPKQTLTIESNAIFSGQVLVRSSLDVAGELKVGSTLNVPGLTVSGTSTLGQVAANDLTVAGNTSIQGQLNVQGNVSFSGSGSFSGPLSAPQINIQTLQISGDLQLNRHIDAGGGTPGKSNGTALGAGGTSSISGTDTAGTLSVNVGGGPAAGCFATITFTRAFNSTPHVVVTPVGSSGGGVRFYVNRSSTSFSICTSTPPSAGTSFAFDYIVID